MNFSMRKLVALLLLGVVTFCCPTTTSASENDPTDIVQGWISSARNQYDKLPDQGKFATGAVLGFTTSKVAVRSAVKFVKIAGAAFVATEVLEAAGILDKNSLSESEEGANIKTKVFNKIGDAREAIHRRLDGKNIKRWMETDKMGTFGAATGAFFGFLL